MMNGGTLPKNNNLLVGGFKPSEKYSSKWESSPNKGENRKIFELPPPSLPWDRNVVALWDFSLVGMQLSSCRWWLSNHQCQVQPEFLAWKQSRFWCCSNINLFKGFIFCLASGCRYMYTNNHIIISVDGTLSPKETLSKPTCPRWNSRYLLSIAGYTFCGTGTTMTIGFSRIPYSKHSLHGVFAIFTSWHGFSSSGGS